jgi:periplasmic protein TonB
MRLDSPFVLAAAGTFALHLVMVVAVDAITVYNPYIPAPPAPRVQMIDVEVPPPPPEPPKPPPPPVAKEPEPVKEQPAPDPKPRQRVAARQPEAPPPPEDTPPPPDPGASGGDEVVQMEDIAPAARGVAVKQGKPATGRVGRGGSGGGTGAGSGSGTEDAPPPVSVATIKKAAMPKGDYAYFSDYPAEAKQLGIEGPIRVRLIVDIEGKVKQATLLNRLGHGLDELALSRAKQIQFEPATDTYDRPVTSVVVWTFHMTLPK